MSALLWATDEGQINIKNDSGKRVWRNVIEYLKEHKLENISRKGLELLMIERVLYSHEKRVKGEFIGLSAECLGLSLMALTIGFVPWYWLSDKIQHRIYGKHVRRHLYPKQF